MDLIQIRKIIYQFDIPKDLAVTTGWTKEQHVKIRKMIQDMFGPITYPNWHAIGDHTYAIDGLLRESLITRQMYTNPVRIVRLKYTTGHLATPRDLFLVQDNGPIDIIYKPKILIGIGAIPDPAGKTKTPSINESYTIINLVKEGRYTTLPLASLQAAGFEMILNGDITINYKNSIYTLQLPTTLGKITETFNEKFEPISGIPRPSYFAGNREKNPEIKKDLDDATSLAKVPSKKYALCKLVGDALQVAHTDYMVTEQSKLPVGGEATFVRANTVVGTTDNGVKKQCIASNLGCIHTDSLGVSRQYVPQGTSEEENLLIRRQQIESVNNELLAHNQSVIRLLQKVVALTADLWVEAFTWREESREKAKVYLTRKIGEMEDFNRQLATLLSGHLATASEESFTAVKALKDSLRFRSPFTSFKGYYKRIITIRSILPDGTIPFVVNKFVPTASFNTMAGGMRIQRGGNNEQLVKILSHLDDRTNHSVLTIICFINEFMPELITYASCMNTAMNMIDLQGFAVEQGLLISLKTYLETNVNYENFKQNINYKWEDDGTFVLINVKDTQIEMTQKKLTEDLFTERDYKELKSTVVSLVVFSKLFTDLFSDVYDDKHAVLYSRFSKITIDPKDINERALDMAATLAIALYENEYRMQMMSTHGDLSPQAENAELRRIVTEIDAGMRDDPENKEIYRLLLNYYMPPSASAASAAAPAAAPAASAAAPAASAAASSSSSSSSSSASAAAPAARAKKPEPAAASSSASSSSSSASAKKSAPAESMPSTLNRKGRARETNDYLDGSGRVSPAFLSAVGLKMADMAEAAEAAEAAKGDGAAAVDDPFTLSQRVAVGESQSQNQRQGGKRRTYKKRKQKKRTTRRR